MSANTPKHYGFAQVPRQVLRGEKYKKKISLSEKGLYTCLKDICGDTGECYYSLRNLALEIGTSASTLTRLIPSLRDAGLIYAEKKVRGTGENKHEIWHIRIVNIWQENDALYKPQDCSILKQSDEKIVSNRNNVVDTSTSVSNCNNCVSNCNKDCFILLANEYLDSNNNLTKEDKEESIANGPSVEPLAPNVALSPASQSSLSSFPQEETQETQSPIVTVTTRNDQSVEQKSLMPDLPKKSSSKTKQRDTEPLLPVMPLQDAPWPSRETAVQIVEAKKGRKYSDATRKQELQEASKVLDMTVDGASITREQFEKAWDEISSSTWWDEHSKPCMIKYLRRDDAIVGIIKKLKRKGRPSSPLQATIVDMDAERERVRIKNEQQLAKQQEMRRKRAELAKQGVNNG